MQRWTPLRCGAMDAPVCEVCGIVLEQVAPGYELCNGCNTVTASMPAIRLE